jgi:hypothetical protein
MDTTEERRAESPAVGPPKLMADARRFFKWKHGQREKARAVLRSIENREEEAEQRRVIETRSELKSENLGETLCQRMR